MKYERVVFLDIDGVVNCAWWTGEPNFDYKSAPVIERYMQSMSPVLVQRLNRLVDIGASFVLSSSWRYNCPPAEMQEVLRRRGFRGTIVDRTPFDSELRGDFPQEQYEGRSYYARGHEIGEWLNDHPTERFVILDDSSDMAHLMDRLVKTSWEHGILDHDVDRAIEMLR